VPIDATREVAVSTPEFPFRLGQEFLRCVTLGQPKQALSKEAVPHGTRITLTCHGDIFQTAASARPLRTPPAPAVPLQSGRAALFCALRQMILPFRALQQLVEVVLHFEQVSRAVKFVGCFHSCFKLGLLFFLENKRA